MSNFALLAARSRLSRRLTLAPSIPFVVWDAGSGPASETWERREIDGSTTGRFSKSRGSYNAISQTLSAEFVAIENFRTKFGRAVVSYNIAGVAGFEDRRQLAFGSFSADLGYRLLDRANASFGLSIGAEPPWVRIDELTEAAVNQCGVDFVLAADKEIIWGCAVGLLGTEDCFRKDVSRG